MLLVNRTRNRNHPRRSRPIAAFPLALCLAVSFSSSAFCAEPLYPVALMNWMVEGSFHALIVDKSQQRLTVWRVKDGEPSPVESYRCATGEKEGDKWVRGDMKTPEGVYFFCSVIDGSRLPTKYGLWALTTDYPNFVDRRRGKSGDGIWVHGRDKPLGPKPDSNGCIALENQDLIKVSRFVRLQSTPLIVVDQMLMAPRSQIIEQERQLRAFIESWRQAWESQDLSTYMKHYSRNFQSSWLDYAGWKEKKQRLLKQYKKINVKLGKVYLYRQNGLITTIFTQAYRSDRFTSTGIKVLYISHEDGYRVYAEDYHQQVDDPNPARTLLAGIGADLGPVDEGKPEFRIRLVSTDEPDHAGRDEIESPRPVAPSRGVVLDKIVAGPARGGSPPALETNEKIADRHAAEQLIVARLLPTQPSQARRIPARRREIQEARVVFDVAASSGEGSAADRSSTTGPHKGDKQVKAPAPESGSRPTRAASEEKRMASVAPFAMSPGAGSSDRNSDLTKDAVEFLKRWKSAWEQKNLDSFLKMYHANFQAGAVNHEQFEKSKRNFCRKYRTIRVEMEHVQVRQVNGGVQVKFLQIFRGDDYRDKGWKSMVLAGSKDKGFRILSETWSPL